MWMNLVHPRTISFTRECVRILMCPIWFLFFRRVIMILTCNCSYVYGVLLTSARFWKLRKALAAHTAHTKYKDEVRNAVYQVWARFYDEGDHRDFHFALGYVRFCRVWGDSAVGTVLLQANDAPGALKFFQGSEEAHGSHSATLVNMAHCYTDLEQLHLARKCLKRCLLADPKHTVAKKELRRIARLTSKRKTIESEGAARK